MQGDRDVISDRAVRSLCVIQLDHRTPTGLMSVSFSIRGIRGQAVRFMSTRSLRRPARQHFRCSLTGIASDRWLEIPAWMFDRATSKSWHLRSAPVASIATLASLAAVLNDAVAARDRPSELRASGAASNSLSVIPGDGRATSIDTPATRPLRSALRRRIASNAAMAEPARRGAADADHVDDPPDPRPRRWRGQAAEGGGT